MFKLKNEFEYIINSDFIDFNGHLTESGFYHYGMLGNIDIFEKCGLIDLFSKYKCGPVTFETNIKFKFNSYFPIRSLNLMRGVLVAEEDNFKNYYIENIFNAIWQDGLNLNDESIFQRILKNLSVNPKTFLLRIGSSSIKDSLKNKTSEAFTRGVFGAPTFVANNKIFWGQDRIEFALNEIKK